MSAQRHDTAGSRQPEDKPRVLFVDDEPAILGGLKSMLFRERHRWEMVFADDPSKALACTRERPFDVVVSDMRMPGLDGASFLAAVKAECPGTARIVLSGHTDGEAFTRALSALHQTLRKPCNPAALRSAIERGFRLRELPVVLTPRIGELDSLLSQEDAHDHLVRVLDRADHTNNALVDALQQDPALCAKVLQLANSGELGMPSSIVSLGRAVALIGTKRLRTLVHARSGSLRPGDPFTRSVISGLQRSSSRTAHLVHRFVPDDHVAHAAAVLHHIGRVALAVAAPESYGMVVDDVGRGLESNAAERARHGATNAEVGACLLELWGLPRPICDAVRWHRAPWSAPPGLRESAAAIYVADRLTDPLGGPDSIDHQSLADSFLSALASSWLAIANPP
jgi:HD-like signal output (HDOD) protein/ActR/RegA family two-component response regulator